MSATLEPSSEAPEHIRRISRVASGGVPAQLTVESASTAEDELAKGPMRKMSVSTSMRKVSTIRKMSMVGPDWTNKMSSEGGQRKISTVSRSDSDVQRKIERSRKISRYNRENTEENTLKFVYSEAVERAIRTQYTSSAFPPISRMGQGIESKCEILKLPEIFDDWISVRKYRKSNIFGERSWRAKEDRRRSMIYEEVVEDFGSNRLPKLQHFKMLRMNRKRGSISTSRLPPVLQVTQEESPNGSEGSTPQSDVTFTV